MKTSAKWSIVTSILFICCASVLAQIPAFPGAEGYGAYASGGRGGDVYIVTSLANNGTGTLREALNTVPAEGRTIVFAVSGYIPVVSDTNFQVPDNVTIAGQTAPGDGIGLQGGRMLINGDNVIMRHFRIRHGKYGTGGDCLNIASGVQTTMLDHLSLMFSTDENFSFFGGYPDKMTMQYSSSSWGMERHNAGGLWDLNHGTCHHSLWAHHRTRNPKARPYGLLEWINNVTYHWRNEGFIMGDSYSDVDWYANIIGCYYISIADEVSGLDTTPLSKARLADVDGLPNFHLYLDDTLIDANGNGVLDGVDNGYAIASGSPDISATPFAGAPVSVTIDDPLTAYKKVLSSTGPLRLDAKFAGPLRDELDDLLIESVVNQESILVGKDTPTTSEPIPPSNGEQQLADVYGISNNGFGTLNSASAPTDTDKDGMPDYWENTLGWNAIAQDHNTVMANAGGYVTGLTFFPENTPAGYTRLEEYLHFMAIPHASIPYNTMLDVDLRRYTDGFSDSPVFSITNVVNGAVEILPDGYTARFTPDADFSGRCRYEFTVTDADGSAWTQTMAVLATDQLVIPDAPSGLDATAISSFQIDLSWVDNANSESGFRIERSTDNENFSEAAVVSANTTTYSDDSLSPDTTYYYRVQAFNGVGSSSYSDVASASTLEGAPSTPADLSASPGIAQVTLNWSASPGANSYIIKRATSSGGPYTNIDTNTTTSYVDSGLVNGTVYFYMVSAVNAFGESADSSPVSAIPTVAIKINSGGPAVSPYAADTYYVGGSTYTNTGSISTGGVTDPAPTAVYQTERHGDFSYVIPGLEPGMNYLVRLHFDEIYHSSSGSRVFDVLINGSVAMDNYDIYAETGARYQAVVHEFTVPADSSGQIEIEYVTITDNSLSSGIEVLTAPSPPQFVVQPWSQSVPAGSTATFLAQAVGDPAPSYIWMKNGVALAGETNATLIIANAQTSDQGMYSVAAYNSLGSVISSEAALTVGSVSDIPTGLFATPGNNEIVLNWYEASGATGYIVKRSTSSGGPYQPLATIPDTTYDDLTVQNGTTYYYVVSAQNTGNTADSSEVSATPEAVHGGLTIQVEDVTTTYGGGVTLDSNNEGFHVSAFANFPSTGGYVQFNNVDGGFGGPATLIIRFALGNTARTGTISVNGVASSITFPGTGAWTTWTTMSVDIALGSGTTNTIRFESTGADLANIDEITVVPTVINVGPPVECSVTNGVVYLNWPDDTSGWILQYSTNLTGDSSWVEIPAAEGSNMFEIDVDLVPWDQTYFRLQSP